MLATPSIPDTVPGLDTAVLRENFGDLHTVRPAIYWLDILLSATLGWTLLILAATRPLFSPSMLALALVCAFVLYRAVSFIHELSHHRHHLPALEHVWNLVVGFPVLMPSFLHAEPHRDHHRVVTFGTENDPEYLPFARSPKLIVIYALNAFVTPPALMLRFLILGPLGFLCPPLERWLVRTTSSFTMNPRYRREAAPHIIRIVRRDTALMLIEWAAITYLALRSGFALHLLVVWWLVTTTAVFVNALRTLGAHDYDSPGDPLTRNGQWADSIDAESRFWAELWAPAGLRYHAIHHYLPGIPYHNLAEANRRLNALVTHAAAHRDRSSPSLRHSLRTLWQAARHG